MTRHVANAAAVEVSNLAIRMLKQYYSHHAAMLVARDPGSDLLMPSIEPGNILPVFRIPRDDGNALIAPFPHYLQQSRDPDV
jgi:hypothetical protein